TLSRDIQRETRTRLGTRSIEGLQPLDVLNIWLESKKIPAERAEIITRYAKQLTDSEESA
ncbi:MAG TPA: hypothetical protein VEH58_02945, partial [Dehalococcoidales bacterium]|nr:hypothetical protein [Dehalococcoidales bacterium]